MSFYNLAEEWALGDYAKVYSKYVDYKILEDYSPNIKLILKELQATGKNRCIFRYIMKADNK
ncbi:MAG: hypothetical protein ACFFDK_11375 [Promethearchaeota archaeon]